MSPSLRRAAFVLAALVPFLVAAHPASGKGSLSKLEDEFEKAIKEVTPATVVCLPRGVDKGKMMAGSSGVIMSRKGLVLSDGDVGLYNDQPGKQKKPSLKHTDEIEVRLPSLKGKGFRSFKAHVIRRDRELDTSLLRIERAPSTLKPLEAGRSDEIKVGDFAFTMGNSFGLAAEAPPTLTAGVIASLVPSDKPEEGGRWSHIYTSAAVNLGVNGGPLVNTRGQLVGTISSAVGFGGKKPDDAELAYAFLGKAVPVDRLRAFYKDLEEYDELFPDEDDRSRIPRESGALETVFHHTARRAYHAVVSIAIERKKPLSLAEPGRGGMVEIPRYAGPVSGILVSDDGWVVSSLYNFANLASLNPRFAGRWKAPDDATIRAGIEGIEKTWVYLPDGQSRSAKLVAYHEGIGVVLLKVDTTVETFGEGPVPPTTVATYRLLEPAPDEETAFAEGRFVLAVGNPFGGRPLADPLLTVGILSKRHGDLAEAPWAGQWQTDAGGTDANAGGAAVDLGGNLLGMMTLWTASTHGRNSGVAFVVPWSQIEAFLPAMKAGRSFRRPLMGVIWVLDASGKPTTTFAAVAKDSAAQAAGLEVGDLLVRVDDRDITSVDDVRAALAGKYAGDRIRVTVSREGEEHTAELELGARD